MFLTEVCAVTYGIMHLMLCKDSEYDRLDMHCMVVNIDCMYREFEETGEV